jgi:phage repressor protein C with HTH and peptisase S24 domain
VIRIDEAVYVKRLRWDIASGKYNIISDNIDYPVFQIDHNNGRNFKIIGKAIAPVFKKIL